MNGLRQRAEVAQRLRAQLHQVAVHAEGLVERQPVVRRRRLGDDREAAIRPVEAPDSTTTPPMLVPCPPMNLVAEWTTMSAPHSIGRHRYGVAKVLSIISGAPCSCAIAGHRLDVEHIAAGIADRLAVERLGLGRSAARQASRSSGSTNVDVDARACATGA